MPRKKKTPTALRDALLAEIKATGKILFRVSQEAGVDHSTLHKFVHGTRQGMQLATVEKLMAYLRLEVRRK
jgi:transposase-like protein